MRTYIKNTDSGDAKHYGVIYIWRMSNAWMSNLHLSICTNISEGSYKSLLLSTYFAQKIFLIFITFFGKVPPSPLLENFP